MSAMATMLKATNTSMSVNPEDLWCVMAQSD